MATFTPNVPVVTSEPTIQVEGLKAGTHRFQLIVEDEFGNRSAPSFGLVSITDRAPLITSVSPEFGNWEDVVVIAGTNFDPQPLKNQVSFNGIEAPVEKVDAAGTQLFVRVPRPAATGLIRVVTGLGEGVSPLSFVIPRLFTVEIGATPTDLALDPVKGNLWVTKGPSSLSSGAVGVISLATKKLLANIAVGKSPKAIAVATAERRICLALNSGGTVTAIDMDSMQVKATIQVAENAIALKLSPDGRWGYVLNLDQSTLNLDQSTVNLDQSTPTISRAVTIGADDLAPGGTVSVIDTSVFKVVRTIPVGPGPTTVAFSPDGQFAVVSNTGAGSIVLIDVREHQSVAVVDVGESDTSNPAGVVFSRKNFPLWTANLGSRSTSIVVEQKVLFNVELKLSPMAVAVTQSGERAFLVGPNDALMTMVDITEGQPVIETVRMAEGAINADAIATTPDDRGVVAVHSDSRGMSVIDARTLRLRANVNLPSSPLKCLVTLDGKFAAVLMPAGNALSVIEMESVLPTES